MKVTYTKLNTLDEFWQIKKEPATELDFQTIEKEKSIKIPVLIKKIYSLSNGGRTEFSCLKKDDKYYGVFPEWIPPMKEWQSFKSYVDDFGLDDEDSLEIYNTHPDAIICYRHGFEVFTLFWSSTGSEQTEMAYLDFNAPVGSPDRFVRCILSSDATEHFYQAHYKF